MKQKTYEVIITSTEIHTIKAQHEYQAINLVQRGKGELYSINDEVHYEAYLREEE
tara:strand:- start:320 stop:484 length:165 start_codon:yes stop_codon:yes gene_type:complete